MPRFTLSTAALRLVLALGLVGLLVSGCDEPPAAPEAPGSETSVSVNVAPWASNSSGKSMVQLTHAVALALQNNGIRERVRQDMRNARYLEHKIHFSSYLAGESGGILRAAMRSQGELSSTEIDELLEEAPDLEFYMPVVEHRRTWTGGPEIIVATSRDDHDLPIGFTTDGQTVHLNPDSPPNKPTLVIVPTETDFSSPISMLNYANRDDAGGGAIGQYVSSSSIRTIEEPILEDPDPGDGTVEARVDWDSQPSGIFVDKTWYSDTGESWTKGSPELEILTAIQDPLSDPSFEPGQVIRCVGDAKTGSQYYEQNNNFWHAGTGNGVPHLATQSQIDALPSGQGFAFLVIEDDDTRCEIKADNTELNNFIDATQAVVDGKDAIDKEEKDLSVWLQFAESVIQFVTNTASTINTNDEIIGMIVEQSCTDPNGTNHNWTVLRGSSEIGCATLQGN